MLKDIAVTPQVFGRHQINRDNWKDILSLLQNIYESGYIVCLGDEKWVELVVTNIRGLDPAAWSLDESFKDLDIEVKVLYRKIKDYLHAAIKALADRQRIVGHPTKEDLLKDCEEDWIKNIIELDKIRSLYRIVAASSFEGKILSIAQLEEINITKEFGNTGARRYINSKQYFEDNLCPLLSYAKKVTVIDPYFSLGHTQPEKSLYWNEKERDKYFGTLNQIGKSLQERRGERRAGTIAVHFNWANHFEKYGEGEINEGVRDSIISEWQKQLKNLEESWGHSVSLTGWCIVRGELRMHDRYIITEQCGVSIGAGIDEDERKQSEWSLLDYREINDILSQYKENSSPFKKRCLITASSTKYY